MSKQGLIFIFIKKMKKYTLRIEKVLTTFSKNGVRKKENTPTLKSIHNLKLLDFNKIVETENYFLLDEKYKEENSYSDKELFYNHWLKISDEVYTELGSNHLFSSQDVLKVSTQIETINKIELLFIQILNNSNSIINYAKLRHSVIKLFNKVLLEVTNFDASISDDDFLTSLKISRQNLRIELDRLEVKETEKKDSIYSLIASISRTLEMKLSVNDLYILEFISYYKLAQAQWMK